MGLYEDIQSRRIPLDLGSQKVERAFGKEKDTQQDRARQALLVGFPGLAPDDALGQIGAERVLPRESGESAVAYAERLRTVWEGVDGWSYAGSHGSLLRALDRAGFPMGTPSGCHVVQRTKRYSYLDGSTVTFGTHSGMTWNEQPTTVWNQFVVLFGADVAGLDVGTPLADTLNRIVRQWKPAKARFMGTYVIVAAPVWGWPPDLDWGDTDLDWDENSSESRFIPPT